jgi:tRNA 2-selenouridine synthase
MEGASVIDVRAPIEFFQGSFPGAINAPLLDDEERRKVGIVYKQQGREAAMRLGHRLVSGENRERKLQSWCELAKSLPGVSVTCYRGGQRSQISQSWLAEAGFELPRFSGGYKDFRAWAIAQSDEFFKSEKLRVVSGATGSGKTSFLRGLKRAAQYPVLDLEALAHHRGSAFGAEFEPQPAQADFENRMLQQALQARRAFSQSLLVEDESRLIGSLHLPEVIFQNLRAQPILLMQVPFDQRVENVFQDYIVSRDYMAQAEPLLNLYRGSLTKIRKRLGDQLFQDILLELLAAHTEALSRHDLSGHRLWIEKLLRHYYDPMYADSLKKRDPVIERQGAAEELAHFLFNVRPK